MTQRIVPMIAYEDTAAAIDWLVDAFGFTEHGERYVMEDGTIGHAELELDGEIVMLATPNRDYQSPRTDTGKVRGSGSVARQPVRRRRGSRGGGRRGRSPRAEPSPRCDVIRPPEEAGRRPIYTAEDLEGHRWMFQQA